MNKAALLRRRLEEDLAERIPAALSPAARSEKVRLPFSDSQPTNLVGGGVPVGAITEVHGALCSGKSSLALSLASAVTNAGSIAAWVDTSDSLDPETAALSGVDLQRLLWVRCGARRDKDLPATSRKAARQTTDKGSKPMMPSHSFKPVGGGGCGSPHPRGEGNGMAEAVNSLLHSQPRSAATKQRRMTKVIGTPGAPNRELTAVRDMVPTAGNLFGRELPRGAMPFPNASPYREEQAPTDRQPSRRAVANGASQSKAKSGFFAFTPAEVPKEVVACADHWEPLDQALRSVDLLLQAGGFSLIVLDLGHVQANIAWRIPLATWFRFRAGCERSRASLLVLSQHPCVRASADLTVAMSSQGFRTMGEKVAVGRLFQLQVEQRRRGAENASFNNVVPFRKPVQSDEEGIWTASTPWNILA